MPGDIHTHVLEKMKEILTTNATYMYLMNNAKVRLAQARECFDMAKLKDRVLIHLGGNMWAIFPWLGSYAFLALERFLKIHCAKELGLKGLSPVRPYFIQFGMNVSEKEFYKIVCKKACEDIDPLSLVYEKEVPVFEKYDEFVPDELVKKGFAYGVLDIDGMKKRVREWEEFL